MPPNKKTTKKTTKAVPSKKKTAAKKTAAKKSSKSPLAQAKILLDKALKKTDWRSDLDTNTLKGSLPHLPMGSLILDHLIGGKANESGVAPCPGLPIGKIINIYGHESSGKSTLALTAAATTIRNGGTVCYIDWENEVVLAYAKALGIPVGDEDKFMLCQPETLEEGCSVLWTMATHGVDLVILDSVGAGVPAALTEKSISEVADGGRLGANAAVWSLFLPKLKHRINKSQTTVLAISQLRSAVNVGGYGDQFTVQGGKAWRFYSAIRMHLKAIGKDKATAYDPLTNKSVERVVGVKTRARLEKCKVSPQQGNEEIFYIRWGKGIDDLRSLIEIGLAHKLIRKGGAYYTWVDPQGEEHTGQGMEKFRKVFEAEPKFQKALEKQIKPYMAAGKSSADGEEVDEEDFFGDSSQSEDELKDLMSAITLVDPPDEERT